MPKPVVHARDHRFRSEDPLLDYDWITVGTPGVDGVDTEIAANPKPFAVSYIPFQDSWTHSLGDDFPVSFCMTHSGWVHIRGGFTNGADGTVVFTLPAGYRPAKNQPVILNSTDGLHAHSVIYKPNGDVYYVTQLV